MPVDQQKNHSGDKVIIFMPTKSIVLTNDGQWEFVGYQNIGQEFVIQEDTTIIGVWTSKERSTSSQNSSNKKDRTLKTSVIKYLGFIVLLGCISFLSIVYLLIRQKRLFKL